MPPVTNAPVTTPTKPVEENVEVTKEVKRYEVIGRGKKWVYVEAVQEKGKGAGNTHYYLDPNGAFKPFIDAFIDASGPENFYKAVMAEIIRPACRDAEHDLDAKQKEGDPDWTPENWIECVFNQLLPGARAAGDGVKQLREKLKVVMSEIKPLMERYMKPSERSQMSPEDVNRLLSLQTQFGELCEKEEKGSRKGKGAKKAAK